MKINARLEDISDGKLYDINDMVKTDTRGCVGCSKCCHRLDNTIVLNPFDMYELLKGLDTTYEALIDDKIELHVEDKITLPNIKMTGATEACSFLDENGWCMIHGYRPGLCRMFPLGRYYEGDGFKYIFNPDDCFKKDLSKIKVKKWIGIENYNKNKEFILVWHDFLKALKFRVKFVYDEQEMAEINSYLIDTFFRIDWYNDKEFYDNFYEILKIAKEKLGVL